MGRFRIDWFKDRFRINWLAYSKVGLGSTDSKIDLESTSCSKVDLESTDSKIGLESINWFKD
jgi:hypothetical protein